MTEEQVRLTVRHISDPALFWTSYPLPTVARCDPAFTRDRGWRGPVWINVNYLMIAALRRAGEFKLASMLADRTVDLVAKHADIAEHYDPETGEIPPEAAAGFGWSAALFIDLFLRREGERADSRRA